MRAALENWLLRHWYGSQQPPWLLRLLEPLYKSVFHRKQQKAQSISNRYQANTPVIIVGNITVGGTGKTPLVIHLCQLAQQLNLKAGIASTGYGRQGRDTQLVTADSDSRLCGDEPVLLAKRTGMPVVVAEKRLDAVKLLDSMKLDIIISDDGLQATNIKGDIEICVIDGSRGFGNGHLIPAGPLRESVDRLSTVDYLVSNGQWQNKPDGLDVHEMVLKASAVQSVVNSDSVSVEEFVQNHAGKEVHAVAGIGNPERFFSMLKNLGIMAECHGFPDHHEFSPTDFGVFNPSAVIVMTEKDAVKCRDLNLKNAWFLPVDSHLTDEFEKQLTTHLKSLTERAA